MKKLLILAFIAVVYSCSSTKEPVVKKPLYEVLLSKNDGGGNIRFYEILTEPNEIKMLLADPDMKKKIKADDVEKSNFIILNMGELPAGNEYSIAIDKIEETPTEIVLTIKETKPENLTIDANTVLVYPYSVVKINSKKTIVVK